MAQIGQFTRDKSTFTGRIQTLFFERHLTLTPAESSDAENAPDYRIRLGDTDGPEIGAGWKRTGEKAGDYVSLIIDASAADPRQSLPVGRRQIGLDAELESSAPARRTGLIACRILSRVPATSRINGPPRCSEESRPTPSSRSNVSRPPCRPAVEGGAARRAYPCRTRA
jgi:uncharacterized protein (DUF736 family)